MVLELKLIDQEYWQISPYLAQNLALEEGESVWLHVGNTKRKTVVTCHGNYTSMSLNKQCAADLKLTPGKWKVRRVREGIRLGPVIGIVSRKLPSQPPAESSWFRYLGAINGGLGILVTPEGFDLERRCVYGLTLSEDKLHWVEGELPWPDALYVRINPIPTSLKALLQKEFPNRHFNTQTLFNKWFVFQVLYSRQDIKPYLPATAILDSDPASLKSWVDRFSTVYAKPVYGNNALGVLRIIAGNENYLISYRKGQENEEVSIPISDPIRQKLMDIMGESQYIMQQALLLHENEKRTCDFRVLLQKKDDGLWHITGLWGRRGAVGSIENSAIPKTQRTKEIYLLCLHVALTLEEHFGQLGEVGLDMCIDCDDKLWIIEVNGMPGKHFFTDLPNVIKNIYTAPMLYCAYLGGFSEVIYPLA